MEASLSNQIFDIKEKLTDAEYKNLMETLATARTQRIEEEHNYYKVVLIVPRVGHNTDDYDMKNDPGIIETSIEIITRVIQFKEEEYAKVGMCYTCDIKDCNRFTKPVSGDFTAENIHEQTCETLASVTFSMDMNVDTVYIASCKKL